MVGLLFGGELTSFNINFFDLSAHAGIEGEFSAVQSAIISACGVCFPLLVWALFIFLVPKKANPLMELLRLVISMAVINSFLAWIIIPIIAFSGGSVSDDSSNFLNKTHIHPLIVAGAALVIYIVGWALFLYRLGGIKTIWFSLRAWQIENYHSIRRSLVWMGIITVAILGIVGVLSVTLENPENDQSLSGYHQIAMLDLSQHEYSNETVYSFNLSQASRVSLFFALDHIQRGPVRIDLSGPNSYSQTFLRYDDVDFRAEKASVHPTALLLEPGEYRIQMTFPQSGGSVTVSILLESD